MRPFSIGKYEIVSSLGCGGMGLVYKGFDKSIQRNVAIKVLEKQHRIGKQGQELERRFKQEAQAAARCQHRNIVAIFDYGVSQQGDPYIVMEYIKGIELKEYLTGEYGGLSIKQSISIILQVLSALNYAHSHGVIHRDIKPSNIIVTQQALVKVMDFGVAKLETSDFTMVDYIVGTPSYMSPEALRADIVDGRSDIYATGQVLLEMLSGKKLDSREAIYERVPALLNEQMPSHPVRDALVGIIQTALSSDPNDRYQNGFDFACELESAIHIEKEHITAEKPIYTNTVVQYAGSKKHQGKWLLSTQSNIFNRELIEVPPLYSDDTNSVILSSDDVANIEKTLAVYIGPLSKVLVRREMRSRGSLKECIDSLVGFISNKKEKKAFLSDLENTGIHSVVEIKKTYPESQLNIANNTIEPVCTDDQLMSITHELAYYIGPIAKHIIEAVIIKSHSFDDFIYSLAGKISNPFEREKFIKHFLGNASEQ